MLKRSGMAEEIPEFQDLREVDAMLEERAAQWKDDYIRQGVLIGRAEGMAEGRAEGKVEGKVEGIGLVLQDLLEARFGSLPNSVTSYIASSSDATDLRKLTVFAYHAESLQAFIEQIQKNDNKLM